MARRAGIGAAAVAAFAIAAACGISSAALAANVSGVLIGSDGRPEAGRQLHFEGEVSGDLFLTPTGADGAFSLELPPGTYDLRAERGAIITSGIMVAKDNIALGSVREPSGWSPMRLFQRQGVDKGIVGSQAGATANIPSIEGSSGGQMTSSASAK
jgi:hypothetical protein